MAHFILTRTFCECLFYVLVC